MRNGDNVFVLIDPGTTFETEIPISLICSRVVLPRGARFHVPLQ
jgi:hypothetical protein